MTAWKDLSGYYLIRHPMHLKTVPTKTGQFLSQVRHIKANFMPALVYATRSEAVAEARKLLTEQRDQAKSDVEFLSKPYTSPNGITYICRPEDEQRWMAEARTSLAIAEAGLKLLDAAA